MKHLFCLAFLTAIAASASDLVGSVVPDRRPAQQGEPPKHFTNALGMKFVWIPPGSFIMGSPKEELQRRTNESQRKVTLTKGFYMGVYAVTQEEWQAVTDNNPSEFRGEKKLPVEKVSWEDCQEFIKNLRKVDKKPYRLPTEAEWEYACRAGTTTPFYFGNSISTEQANYFGEAAFGNGKIGVNRKKTTPVGSFPANVWGLYDMHGNVWQWCQDWYEENPKEVVDPQGPKTGAVPVFAADGFQPYRVQRGNSWGGDPMYCRSACRTCGVPGWGHAFVGLRLCFFVE
jgi:formylglycine-generating enzyme required for sulfatase activity